MATEGVGISGFGKLALEVLETKNAARSSVFIDQGIVALA